MASGTGARQRVRTVAGRSPRRVAPAELPADIWAIIFEHLAQTDLLRSADVAARDIAAAACTCHTAFAQAGFGWRVLRPAVPAAAAVTQPAPDSEEDAQRCYEAARTFHQDHSWDPTWDRMVGDLLMESYDSWYGQKQALIYYGSQMPKDKQTRWLEKLLPLHSRSCPMSALKLVLSDKYGTIKATQATKQFRVTKKDLASLQKDSESRYSIAVVRAIATEKWGNVKGLQERQLSVADATARRKQAAQDRRDAEKALRWQLFKEALAAAGVGEEHFEALQRMQPAKMFLGTARRMPSRYQQSEQELPFQGEVDEAPLLALRARREYSRRTGGFPAPAEDEDPYQADEGELSIQVVYHAGGNSASGQVSKQLRAKPALRFGRAMAHFCFLEGMALGQLAFQAGGRKVFSNSYGSTLEQLGIQDRDVIDCVLSSSYPSWLRPLLS